MSELTRTIRWFLTHGTMRGFITQAQLDWVAKHNAEDPLLNKLRAGIEYVRHVEAGGSPRIH